MCLSDFRKETMALSLLTLVSLSSLSAGFASVFEFHTFRLTIRRINWKATDKQKIHHTFRPKNYTLLLGPTRGQGEDMVSFFYL